MIKKVVSSLSHLWKKQLSMHLELRVKQRLWGLLAELETPEAKFDYSSYTETIKTQTQNVIDRVAIFNNAVTKYEQKVEELDQTLAGELGSNT